MRASELFAYSSLSLFLLMSCNVFEDHSRLLNIPGQKDLNAQNIARIETTCLHKDTIRFALVSDTHDWYNDCTDYVAAINQRSDLDFVIHLGDLTDYGLPAEHIRTRDILLGLRVPFVVIIGNHDMMGNGRRSYNSIYGPDNFSFIAGNTKFLCMKTFVVDLELTTKAPDFSWLHNELQDSSAYVRTVAAMHIKPGDPQFDKTKKEAFQDSLKRFPGLCFALHGHNHAVQTENLFNDGILYYGEASIEQRHYFVFTLHPTGYYVREYFF